MHSRILATILIMLAATAIANPSNKDNVPDTSSLSFIELPRNSCTIITHGATGDGVFNGPLESWMLPLARAIRLRDSDPSTVNIYIVDNNTIRFVNEYGTHYVNDEHVLTQDSHSILLFDWATNSDVSWEDGEVANDGFAYAAGDVLYSLIRAVHLESNIHMFIGHSRGSVVVTEAARRMSIINTHPDNIIFVDGEGGHFGFLPDSYTDSRFGPIAESMPYTSYINIYTTYNEGPCLSYAGLDFGGHEAPGSVNYNLGPLYSHGGNNGICETTPPSVTDALVDYLVFQGGRYSLYGHPFYYGPSGPLIPANNWDSDHTSGHNSDAQLYNGDFGWHSRAGWKNHGAPILQAEDPNRGFIYYLALTDNQPKETHSYTWIDPSFTHLSLSVRVNAFDLFNPNDLLTVKLRSRQLQTTTLATIQVSGIQDWLSWHDNVLIPVPSTLRGDSYAIEFEYHPIGGIFSGQIDIDNVTFKSVGDVSQPSADIITCIDRSGSMRGQKIADAKNAASTFVGLMTVDDMIGVTSFSSGASVNYPLTLIQGQTQKDQAIAAINSLNATGGTSIGSGMSASQNQFNSNGQADDPWAIILLSDGHSDGSEYNVLPTIPEHTDIYTIGLGAGADHDLMNYIANQTGGTYHAAPNSQDLQQIYNAIRGQITGQQTIASSTGSITQGGTEWLDDILIDQGSGSATFSISWSGSDVDLILHAPDGSIINPSIAETDPDITYFEALTYEYYRVVDPLAGIWRMELSGIEIPAGGEPYSASVQANSFLTMTSEFSAAENVVCDPIHVMVTLDDQGIPVPNALVIAGIDAPLAVVTRSQLDALEQADNGELMDEINISMSRVDAGSIPLFDDGLHEDGTMNDGVYGGYYSGTEVPGSYTFSIFASGQAPISGSFSRQDLLTTIVVAGNTSPPTAIIGTDIVSGPSPLTIQFTDLSAGCINGRIWDFGDGATSTEANPVHVYSSQGSFEVLLTVQGPGGEGTATRTIDVETGGCLWTDATTGPLADEHDGHGIAWGDYDDDGDDDLFLANAGWNVLLRNDRDGNFVDTDMDFGYGDSRAAAWADYDDDGDLDLYLINFGSDNVLFRNNGGSFEDVTTPDLANAGDGNGCAWADYDLDGWLDLYVVNETGPNSLFHNENGDLVLVTGSPVAFDGLSRGCAWGDYDNDADPDLYVTVKDGANKLFRNDRQLGFVDVSTAPINDSGSGKGCAWADYDNDGWLDLYVVNKDGANKLFRNDPNGWFIDATDPVVGDEGDGRTAAWGDYDNDGWLDLFVSNYSTPNKLFHNLHDGTFADSTCGDLASIEMTAWGAGFADDDLDGDLDLYVSNHTWTGAPNRMFRNSRNSGTWLEIVLEGTNSNRRGIGAKVEIITQDITQTRYVTSGANYMAQQPTVVHAGLADATSALVRITWPSGLVQEYPVTGVEHRITIVEGAVTGIDTPELPLRFSMSSHPNPFNPSTTIKLALPEPTRVTLKIYDMTGRLIRTLLSNQSHEAGVHDFVWNGRNQAGQITASGVYFARVKAGIHEDSLRMVLIK